MPQIFDRSADAWLRAVLVVAFAAIPAWLVLLAFFGSHPGDVGSRMGFAPEQPIPFSHKHHVGGLGLDCRYCHGGVETGASAGFPSTEICMTCHSQIWTNAEPLKPLRDNFFSSAPIRWRRVHDLPDFVYFHHGVHIHAGVPCAACHGDVTKMPLMYKARSLTMAFCLDCHRNPEPNLVAKASVFDPQALARAPRELAGDLKSRAELEACNACHR